MTELLFVYNAKSGIGNALLDWGHKIVSPSTYSCDLCSLSYGNLGMKSNWKQFLKELHVPYQFLYKNQLQTIAPQLQNIPLPFIALTSNKSAKVIVSATDFKNIKTEQELIEIVKEELLKHSV